MYEQLAHLYDWPGALDFSEEIVGRAERVLQEHGLTPPSEILDVGCGTGTVGVALAQAGWKMTGLDISEAMLSQARRKAAEADVNVQWMQGDMRSFALMQPADAILCFYDTLNHLLSQSELEQAFQSMGRALKPGGTLLFDLNTWGNYETYWTGSDQWEGPNCRLTFESQFNPESGRSQVTILADEYTDDGYQNNSETVYEQYYDEETIRQILKNSGFEVVSVEAFNPIEEDNTDSPLKTFWVCSKAG